MKPGLFIMHDHTNLDPAEMTAWGPVSSWMWWNWASINPGEGIYAWPVIDAYLERAAALGKPVAISIIPYPGFNQDKTPEWIYRKAGVAGGWTGSGSRGTPFTYPRWNDGTWTTAFHDMIMALGQRYDQDDRVHSVWACTPGLYGETVLTFKDNSTGESFAFANHNPGLAFSRTLMYYAEAFPNKPVFPIITGNVDRLKLTYQAIGLGLGIKLNGLNYEGPMHVQLQPVKGAGTYEVARLALAAGAPVAWEHAWNKTRQSEGYWSMLMGLTCGMVAFDGEIEHLDTLAAIPGLWNWLLRMMAYPHDKLAMWVARDTIYPPPGNGWEHGWPGAWIRGKISANVQVGAPDSPLYRAAPGTMTNGIYGYGGIGRCNSDDLLIELDLPPGNYDVEVIAGRTDWQVRREVIKIDGPMIGKTEGNCWVHRIVVTPSDKEPPPPPPPPPDLTKLAEDVKGLLVRQDDILEDMEKQDAVIRDLSTAQAMQLERLGAIEQRLVKMRTALE